MDNQKRPHSIWEALAASTEKYPDNQYPKVSIVIPTYNCSQAISETLDSILTQDYPSFEIVVIDAASKDRTLEVVKSYHSDLIKIHTVDQFQRYEILNKGISFASGSYLNFLFPGDYYLCQDTLRHIMTVALDTSLPHLAYCGSLVRDGRSEVKMLFRPLTLDNLKRGLQPTTLQSCWFLKGTFEKIGNFNPHYQLRGGLDLLCRFRLKKDLRCGFTTRILTDYDIRAYKKDQLFIHFKETWRIIYSRFGLKTALLWLFKQRDLTRLGRLWWRAVKRAFRR